MSEQERIAALEKANAELRQRLDALEEPKPKAEPFKPPPYQQIDWTANFTLPRSAVEAMVRAVPDNLVRSIVGDNVRSAPMEKPAETKVIPSQRGWVEPAPLGPYEGQRWVDMQLDAQAALDKGELEKKLGVKPFEDGGKDG
jgi:hypothetical protein